MAEPGTDDDRTRRTALDAVAVSGPILAAGFQDLTNFKALSVAKSVREAIDLQSTLSQAVTVKATAEAKKLIDASIKLTEQALAPLTNRMAAAVEGFAKAA